MNKVYLGLGSNIGERLQYLRDALHLLSENNAIEVEKISSVYATSPVGGVEQDDFLNLVLQIETTMSANGLLVAIHNIEKSLDRRREIHWGPRTIDLDILYFNEENFDLPDLAIPHSEIGQRLFVLLPLLEICDAEFYQRDWLQEQVEQLQNSGQDIKKLGVKL